ncbi:Gfo/Idh/MocA family oxidoreductase, partial [Bacillus atrophaeus]|uniref:Gfo/Idh/MocA family oxidoreductase n=1 Tax=Bacillus atrophaeus TaxID=1452 RepID=UPI003BF527E6
MGADTSEWEQGFDCFLSQVDMVYIKTAQEKREKYIRRSLEQGKYVISDAPMAENKEKLEELFALAAAHHVLL